MISELKWQSLGQAPPFPHPGSPATVLPGPLSPWVHALPSQPVLTCEALPGPSASWAAPTISRPRSHARGPPAPGGPCSWCPPLPRSLSQVPELCSAPTSPRAASVFCAPLDPLAQAQLLTSAPCFFILPSRLLNPGAL